MTAETKEDISLSVEEENTILQDIFRNLDKKTGKILASLRVVLVDQDKKTVEKVQHYVASLSTKIADEAAANTDGGIPPSSLDRIQKAVRLALNDLVTEGNVNKRSIQQFYRDAAKFITENSPPAFASAFLRTKAFELPETVKDAIPDFWDVKERKKTFRAFWDTEIVAFAIDLPINQGMAQKKFIPLYQFAKFVILPAAILSAFYTESLKPGASILIGYTVFACACMLHGITEHGNAAKIHIEKEEKKLCQFEYVRIKRRKQQVPEYESKVSPLPTLAEMHSQFAAASTPINRTDKDTEKKEEDSTASLRKKLLKREKQNAPPTPPPITVPPAKLPAPVVNLSETLGHAASYAGEQNKDNTLFQFKATSEEDLRYVFIHPALEAQMETEEQWSKFVETARHTRLASKRNKQGIKTLGVQIADPETGIRYPAVELKILGKYGDTRLLGAMVTIKKDNEEYNVYVFNTFWDKKALPDHFAHPLICSSPTSAAAAVAQASPFFSPALPDALPSYAAAPLPASGILPPSYEETAVSGSCLDT